MAHLHEKVDFTTSVYIVQNGRVLLHKHKKLGIWLPPGGHIELDEDATQAALREAREETGLVVDLVGHKKLLVSPQDGSQDLLPPMFVNRHRINETHEHVDSIYFATVVGGDLQPEEDGGEIGWFSREEIENDTLGVLDAIRSYALAAIDYFNKKEVA